ncbi:MAG TPA: hypothetical protein VIN07_09550 [Flavipsychrobacter sp.]
METYHYFFTIIGGFVVVYELRDYLKTPKEKYDEEVFISGELKPDPLLLVKPVPLERKLNFSIDTPPHYPIIHGIQLYGMDKWYTPVGLVVGNVAYSCLPQYLYSGFNIFNVEKYPSSIKNNNKTKGLRCSDINLIFGLHDSKLYVSVEFKDLQKEETIGYIEFNHWKLYKPNLLDFRSDNKRLEVRDKQNNIVLAVAFVGNTEMNIVNISGYLIGTESVFVMPNGSYPRRSETKDTSICISKYSQNWKTTAQLEISKLKSVF